MLGPKKFGDNPSEATELKKNNTEKFGIDQDGVGKFMKAEVLMTKENVGLGNVPNVTTNNQTPTYTMAEVLAALVSGETLTLSLGKLAKGVESVIAQLDGKSAYRGTLLESAFDIDGLLLSGFYTAPANAVNNPTALEIFSIIHINSDAGTTNALQIAIGTSSLKIYFRKKNTTWYAWSTGVSSVELGYVAGLTSAAQTQLNSLAGTGRTTENIKANADALAVLNGIVSVAGSVLKSIKDNAENATFTPAEGSGIEATTLKNAINEVGTDVVALTTGVNNNKLYSDSQYLELKAKADAMTLEIQASRAELYNGYRIYHFGATDIIGKGTKADYSAIDVSATVVDGKLTMEQKGLTIRNIVNGANIADDGTVTFASILNDKYYDTLNNAILTGTGSDMTATNESGATANMGIYHLNAHGLQAITSTAILAQLLPYVEGTKNVGKMGVRIKDDNLFDGYNGLGVSADYENKATAVYDINSEGYIFGRVRLKYKKSLKLPKNTNVTLSLYGYNSSGSGVRTASIRDSSDTLLFTLTSTTTPGRRSVTFNTGEYNDLYFWVDTENASAVIVYVKDIMLNLGSSALPFEPFKSQTIFLPAIGNSLPNGTADSVITVIDGWNHSKRVSTPASVSSGVAVNTTNYPTAKNAGQWVNELTAGGTEIGVVGTDSTTGAGMLRFELATTVVTKYNLPLPTSGKTVHRFAGEPFINLYGTGVTFTDKVKEVLYAYKFSGGEYSDIKSTAIITNNVVTFNPAPNATDTVHLKVESDVNMPLGVNEHIPAVSNTASRLKAIEDWIAAQ